METGLYEKHILLSQPGLCYNPFFHGQQIKKKRCIPCIYRAAAFFDLLTVKSGIQDFHKFLSGNRFLFIQEFCQFLQLFPVFHQNSRCFLMLFFTSSTT